MAYYKLDENRNVVPCSIENWSSFIENSLHNNHRQVGDDIINGKRISTCFFGICFAFDEKYNKPVAFETMVFDENGHGIYQARYCIWEEAELGHERAMQWVRETFKDEHRNM